MASFLFLIVFFMQSLIISNVFGEVSSKISQQSAVEHLIQRLLPDYADKFVIEVDFALKIDDKDVFIIEKPLEDSPIRIQASSGVAAAGGLNHYLKYICKAQISWDYNQLNVTRCPFQDGHLYEKVQYNDRYRYYQNACTPSYSFVWYDWNKWEKHIDWMALQGFNLVPAQNGQEEIWRRVYSKLGLTRQEIDEQFAGPAFLAWNRMGNLRGWAGPLSISWHAQQVELNKKIIRRMREFGMTTILPAFGGQVPRALKRIYPNSTFYELPDWNGFTDAYNCPYLLNPRDELFQEIATLFLTESTKEFGTDHVYNCDTFNEMTPFTTDLDELRQIGQSIYTSMSLIDPNAIWLLQGWLFYYDDYWINERVEAYLTSVPLGKMIILDLQSEQFPQYERLDNYYGQPYIWCMLHNFGGTLGMFGSADIINERVFEARNAPNSTLIGTGLTPEGIDQNYVIYDLMTEMSWRKFPVNLRSWFAQYGDRRYGFLNDNISEAWLKLYATIYSYNTTNLMRGKFVYNRSPRTKIVPWSWYDKEEVTQAQKMFFAETNELLLSENGYHDYVDLTRQVLQNLADDIYPNLILAFQVKNLENFLLLKAQFLKVIDLIEGILSTDEKWQLSKWLEAAKSWATNEEEAILFEYNARNQITLWGPKGQIMDYANKQWSGIVKDFFKPRWELFLSHMEDSLRHGTKFNEKAARADVFDKVEAPFTFSRKEYPLEPVKKSYAMLAGIQKEIVALQEQLVHFNKNQRRAMLKRKVKKRISD